MQFEEEGLGVGDSMSYIGFVWQSFASRGAAEVASVTRC